MELLSPAGNIEKLATAYRYGADAAYIGLDQFSLRSRADNFSEAHYTEIEKIKGDKKLYCALNIFFHNQDIKNLEEKLERTEQFPFDAFIVSDLGIISLLKKRFPHTPLHLSTQANCINTEAAKVYRDLGFSRIILGREMSLSGISEIKKTVPDLEIETFVHGAMCLAYSGRCFLSAYMAGRSANKGDCAHSCRWEYRVLEEKERPGEYYPVEETDTFTTVLSSRDLCMIDYIPRLITAGIDSAKIEGRMKSVYYTALVTRAYRKAIDSAMGMDVPNLEEYKNELYKVSHREFTTGFYFDTEEIQKPTEESYIRSYIFLGTLVRETEPCVWELDVKNSIYVNDTIELIGPDHASAAEVVAALFDSRGQRVPEAHHSGGPFFISLKKAFSPGTLLRRKLS